jgi:hypothetical protein
MPFAAAHESVHGPSRHFAAKQRLGRFWREADINWQARSAGSVANDPRATLERPLLCCNTASFFR